MIPSPEQASQRPPLTLNEKRPFLYPRILPHWYWQINHEYHQKHWYKLLDLSAESDQLDFGQYQSNAQFLHNL